MKAPKIDGYDLETVDGCQAAYKALRLYVVKLSYSGSDAYPTNEAFDTEVRKILASEGIEDPTPQDWVRCAGKVEWGCKRCAGTGKFITMVMNGSPTGPGGPCFRCNGKGYQRPGDAHRNYWYEMKRPVYA